MSDEKKPVIKTLVEEHMKDVPADRTESVLAQFDAADPEEGASEEDDSDKEGPAYIVVNANPEDPDVKMGKKPYRLNLSITFYEHSNPEIEPRRQVLLVTKYRRYVSPTATLTIYVNTRFESAEGKIDGLPNYEATHQGCRIHCVAVPVLGPDGQPVMDKDGVPVTTHVVPDEKGVLRGAMEINWRVATKLEPMSLEAFLELENREEIEKKDPKIQEKLADPDKLSPRQLLELPLEVMKTVTNNAFNSINVYPAPAPDPSQYVDEITATRVERVDPQSNKRQDREKAREQTEEKREKLLERMKKLGGKMRRFGPDRNDSYVFIT